MVRMALFWGTLWPALLPILCVLGLFAVVALLEIPALLPAWSHVALLVLFALLLIGAVWLGDRQWRKPPAGAVAERLERDSGLIHRPPRHLAVPAGQQSRWPGHGPVAVVPAAGPQPVAQPPPWPAPG